MRPSCLTTGRRAKWVSTVGILLVAGLSIITAAASIGVVLYEEDDVVAELIRDGAERACDADARCEGIWFYESHSPIEQAERIEDALEHGHDALIVQYSYMADDAIRSAMADGTVVVSLYGTLDCPCDVLIRNDGFRAGQDAAWAVIRLLQEEQSQRDWGIAIDLDDIGRMFFADGIFDTLSPIRAMHHASVVDMGGLPYGNMQEELRSQLREEAVDAILISSYSSGSAAAQVVAEEGASAVIVYVGNLDGVGLVENEEVDAAVVSDVYTAGNWSILAALDALDARAASNVGVGWETRSCFTVPPAVVTADDIVESWLWSHDIPKLSRALPFPAEPQILDGYAAVLIGIDYGANQNWGDDALLLCGVMEEWDNWAPRPSPPSLSRTTIYPVQWCAANCTLDELRDGMIGLGNNLTDFVDSDSDNMLFFFFASGHGTHPEGDETVDCPSPDVCALNTCDETIVTYGAPLTDDALAKLEGDLRNPQTTYFVNLIDTCYSGGFWGGRDGGDLERLPAAVLMSAAPEDGVAGGDSPFLKALVVGIQKGYLANSGLALVSGEPAPADTRRPVFVQETWLHPEGRWCRGNGNEDGMITIDEWYYWGYNALDILRYEIPDDRCDLESEYGTLAMLDSLAQWRMQSGDEEASESTGNPENGSANSGRNAGNAQMSLSYRTSGTDPRIFWSGGSVEDFEQWPFGQNPFGNIVLFFDETG